MSREQRTHGKASRQGGRREDVSVKHTGSSFHRLPCGIQGIFNQVVRLWVYFPKFSDLQEPQVPHLEIRSLSYDSRNACESSNETQGLKKSNVFKLR